MIKKAGAALRVNSSGTAFFHGMLNTAITKTEREGNVTKDTYSAAVTLTVETEKISSSYRTKTCLKNDTKASVEIDMVSSAAVKIENTGSLPFDSDGKYSVYFCRSGWLGEGQWQKANLADIGIYETYCDHSNKNAAIFESKGSQSTKRFFPLVIIVDEEQNEAHYFESECGSGWRIEIGSAGGGLFVIITDSCEENDGWHKKLEPGEAYETSYGVWGYVKGGFEEAVHALTDYRRAVSKANYKDGKIPVCYNNYMNASWAGVTPDKIFPLAEAAKNAGAELFCMDDGWFTTDSHDKKLIGDWIINDDVFSPYGLKGVIDYIHSLGLKFGIWLELECCQVGSGGYQTMKDCLLTRRGRLLGGEATGARNFYDFTKKKVTDKMEEVFDRLYAIGVRYIKNDYNSTTGIGADGEDSLSEKLKKNKEAFYGFIDRMREKYPDLIIENCGSGALRSDGETLSHFHLQSTSDQEIYDRYPSILSGSMACMAPEKAGIWTYPYPLRHAKRDIYTFTEEELLSFADGKMTCFNMVNSMMGVMYMSGRLDVCDSFNMNLVKEGVSVYKTYKDKIARMYPCYPGGTFRIKDRGIQSFALLDKEENEMYLAVWNLEGDGKGSIDLSKYGDVKKAEKLYPSLNDYRTECNGNIVKTDIPEGKSAVLIKVNFK